MWSFPQFSVQSRCSVEKSDGDFVVLTLGKQSLNTGHSTLSANFLLTREIVNSAPER
jgi:hypothetical protein